MEIDSYHLHEIIEGIENISEPNIVDWVTFFISLGTFIILIITLIYTKKAFKETRRQTEINQKPVLLLFIGDYKRLDRTNSTPAEISFEDTFSIAKTWIFKIRNTGNGTALNVKAKFIKPNFKVTDYQQNFLEPNGDEQAFATDYGNYEIGTPNEDLIIRLTCNKAGSKKKKYAFFYRIDNFAEKKVTFLYEKVIKK